jgi:hypothetical protein
MSPRPAGHGIVTVVLDWKTSGVGLPPSNSNVPVWPLRSGRLPKVIEMAGPVGRHTAETGTENRLGVGGRVVVVVPPPPAVVVVLPAVVVVALTVVVVPPELVVVVAAVVVVALAVVVVAAAVVVVAFTVVVG